MRIFRNLLQKDVTDKIAIQCGISVTWEDLWLDYEWNDLESRENASQVPVSGASLLKWRNKTFKQFVQLMPEIALN